MTSDKTWKPHNRQTSFLSLPDSIFEALYGGSAGGGKSESLLMLPIVRGFYKEPRFKGIIFRRTYPELESEIIVRSREWYPLTGAKYNEERKRWTFPSGAIMRFGHAEYEEDVRKYDTDEYNYMAFDELTSFTEFMYTYLSKTRCRSSSNRLPAIVRSGTNPGNVGHAWVRDYFIQAGPFGTIIHDKKTNLKRIFIQSFAEDNPYLMENDPGYVNRLESLPEAERQAKRYGHWDSFEGQVFDDYREIPNEAKGEPVNASHIVKPFQIPNWWLKFLAIDWGYSAMTIALWGALSPDDKLYIYREYSITHAKTSTWATDIGRISQGETYSDIVLCRSAWQNRGDELTQQEQFTKYSGLTARMADNDRIAGKLLIQEYLRWKDKPASKVVQGEMDNELATKILRNQGIEAYKSYLSSFTAEEKEEHLPKLQIFPDCAQLRKCIPLCIYDKKSNTTNKPAEDVKEFNGDDPYDTLRYLVSAVDKYLGTLKSEGDHRSRVNTILEKFNRTNDYNYLHRAMERVEGEIPEVVAVRRFHHAK
jgi:Terminase large subunit, T4likevirus-type, N-terminal